MTEQSNPETEISRYTTLYGGYRTGWHRPDINPTLIKYTNLLLPDKDAKSDSSARKTIFLPLCGKTKDIAYLLSTGFNVFGIEGVRQAIEELNDENSFNLKYNPSKSIYATEDERLIIYHGDIFKCPIESWGPFDCVWDRGAFGTVAYDLRDQYIDVIRRGLNGIGKPLP